MVWWLGAAQHLPKIEAIRSAEHRLLQYARQFGAPQVELRSVDTWIARSAVPLLQHSDIYEDHPDEYVIHSVQVHNDKAIQKEVPLVLLHGYMNGAAYFYRNLAGLANYFQDIHSLDLLGWGLSSRPKFLVDQAEDFFVESLEAWRRAHKMDKMILAGHSMGGYLSIAYCEKYPQHVERLILISPVGVNEKDPERTEQFRQRISSTWRGRIMLGLFQRMFDNAYTPGDLLRMMPERRTYGLIEGYVQRRVPAISDPDEQNAVADYLHRANQLPGSGEYCLHRILDLTVHAHNPAVHRVPSLNVSRVTFLYGDNDWMDVNGGLESERLSKEKGGPHVEVYSVSKAGHLLMLDNWKEFNAGVMLGAGARVTENRPQRLHPQLRKPESIDAVVASSSLV